MTRINVSVGANMNPADFLVSEIKAEDGEELISKLMKITQEQKITDAVQKQQKYWKNQ